MKGGGSWQGHDLCFMGSNIQMLWFYVVCRIKATKTTEQFASGIGDASFVTQIEFVFGLQVG